MKTKVLITLGLFAVAATGLGQGTFIYDQQSSDESLIYLGDTYINHINGPGQSFTPTLSSVGFIRLYITDNNPGDALGGSFFVNVRSGSVTGTILGTSSVVTLPNSTLAAVDFLFGVPVAVTPGTTYYFDLKEQTGDNNWTANISFYNYAGGTLYNAGVADPSGRDLWFREGVVPEPSSFALLLLGGGLVAWFRKRN